MGKKYLIDTNVLIDYQTQSIQQQGQEYVAGIIDDSFTVSFISYIEFLGYANVSDAMENFIKLATVIKVDKNIINQTIKLRKTSRIKLPDAIIAATAIVNNLTLISRNFKDFKKIANLETIDPHSL